MSVVLTARARALTSSSSVPVMLHVVRDLTESKQPIRLTTQPRHGHSNEPGTTSVVVDVVRRRRRRERAEKSDLVVVLEERSSRRRGAAAKCEERAVHLALLICDCTTTRVLLVECDTPSAELHPLAGWLARLVVNLV